MSDPLKTTVTGLETVHTYPKHVQQLLFREMMLLADEMKETAPLGQGSLKASMRVDAEDKGDHYQLSVVSNKPYAIEQDTEILVHVPKATLGQTSFVDYGRKVRSKKKKGQASLQNPRTGGTRGYATGSKERLYAKGYYHALQGRFPKAEYRTNYSKEALGRVGGIKGMIQRVLNQFKP